MGYFSLDIKKAKGTSDTTQSDHIERKIIPKNADPTRTHLNRVLVEYPDGVHGRDEAIAHRLNTAGIRRKITHDQVRVVRVVLSGTHEDMMNIQEKGELDEWCNDSIQWLQATIVVVGDQGLAVEQVVGTQTDGICFLAVLALAISLFFLGFAPFTRHDGNNGCVI